MVRQAEIVVRGEDDHVTGFFHVHLGGHRPGEVAQALVGSGGAQGVQIGVEAGFEGGVHRVWLRNAANAFQAGKVCEPHHPVPKGQWSLLTPGARTVVIGARGALSAPRHS
jgi:hypothetical protein